MLAFSNGTTVNINKGVSGLQWNAKGLHSMGHGAELIQLISNNKSDIICIQETWFGTGSKENKKPKCFKIPGHSSYLANREHSTRGGLTTLIKNSTPHIKLKLNHTTQYNANRHHQRLQSAMRSTQYVNRK